MLTVLLLLSCGDENPDFTPMSLRLGRARFEEETRRGLAYAPDEYVNAVGAVASECTGTVGETQVGPRWQTHKAEVSGPFESSCGAPLWVESPLPAQKTMGTKPRDVLVVILDTFRADHMTQELTPRIWSHAQGSWWPQSAWSPSSWTVPSVSALFTGRPPWAITNADDHRLPDEHASLWELVPQHPSWMISTNAYISASNGFDQGLDRFARVQHDKDALALAQSWWQEPGPEGRVLIVQLMTSHLPYEPKNPPQGKSPRVGDQFWDLDNWSSYKDPADQVRIRNLYSASVQDLDTAVGTLLDLVGPEAITVLVSDHGEELFEHGGFEHGHAFWEEITRIHAAIHVPGTTPSRPDGLWTTQAIGQQIGRVLGLADQSTWAPSNRTTVVHGYPLKQRDQVRHNWGVRTEDSHLFAGPKPSKSGDSEHLHSVLKAAKSTSRTSQAQSSQWCDVAVQTGVDLALPNKATWPSDSPPAAWGKVSTGIDSNILHPTRSGTWRLSGVAGENCETHTTALPWDFSLLEKNALEALGYLQSE
jgi:hypothetical protein